MEDSSMVRQQMIQFLLFSSAQLGVRPIVKYTALSLYAERFYPSLNKKARFMRDNSKRNWLLRPFRESNMQLFALISLWISSKIHESCPLSVKSLKSLGDEIIGEQHFTIRDFLESEVVFMQVNLVEIKSFFFYTIQVHQSPFQVLDFEIGVSNIAFLFLEDLLIQFRELARVGELVNFETCMNIMDLLYETEETSSLYASPCSLAASILVASYVITVPKQQWEFPLLPWVKFVTSYKEESIEKLVRTILEHVLKDHLLEKKSVLEEKV